MTASQLDHDTFTVPSIPTEASECGENELKFHRWRMLYIGGFLAKFSLLTATPVCVAGH